MSHLERKSLAYLLHCPGIGHTTLWSVKHAVDEEGGDWNVFWEDTSNFVQEKSLPLRLVNSIIYANKEYTVDAYFEYLINRNIRVIIPSDDEYPVLLHELERPPVLMYCKGKSVDKMQLPIAVVGSRHMTAYGAQATEHLVRHLALAGVTIVSGGMYGVDTCAHKVALKQCGYSVAVLGYGFDHWYPVSHGRILESLLEDGLSCLSPFAPECRPTKGSFAARNMLVAGMSLAVVVTEAGLKSGTHITASCAAELGRSVCAVPGPISSPYSQGTAWLINQGATIVTSAQDILSTLPQHDSVALAVTQHQTPFSGQERNLVEMLQTSGPASVEFLSDVSKQTIRTLLCELSQLEIRGKVVRDGMLWRIR